jgi:hypothetical protein
VDDLREMIDAVDWGSYSHAYGPAVEMSDWLRAWLDGVPEEATEGEGITVSVFHQGDVHSAAEPLMPIVLAVLASDRTDLHVDAMYWAATALGAGCSWTADGFDPVLSMCPPAHHAASLGLPAFLRILESSESEALTHAARGVLPWLPSRAIEIATWIESRLPTFEQPDDLALILATVDWHHRSRAHADYFRRLMTSGKASSTRVAGAVALARIRAADGPAHEILNAALAGQLDGVGCQGLWCEEDRPTDPVTDALLLTIFPSGSPDFAGGLNDAEVSGLQKLIDAFPPPDAQLGANESAFNRALARAQAQIGFPGNVFHHFSLPTERRQVNDVLARRRVVGGVSKSAPDGAGRFHAPHLAMRRWNVTGTWVGPDAVAVRGLEPGTITLLSLSNGTERRTLLPAPILESARPPDAWNWPDMPQWLRAFGSPNGRWLAADGAGVVGIWNTSEADSCRYLAGFAPTRVILGWSPDSERLAAIGRNELRIYQTEQWTYRRIAIATRLGGLDWSPKLLGAAGFGFGPILAWDSDVTGEPTVAIERGGNMGAVATAPNVAAVAAPIASQDGGITIAQRSSRGGWNRHAVDTPGGVIALAWSTSGSYLAAVVSGLHGPQVALWETVDDIPTGDPALIQLGSGIPNDRALSWHPRQELLAVDAGHTVDIFSPHAAAPVARLRPFADGFVWETPRSALGTGPDWVSMRSAAHIVWQAHLDGRPTLLRDRADSDGYWDPVVRPDLVFRPFSAEA